MTPRAVMERLEVEGDLPLRITFHDILAPEDDGADRSLALQGLGGRRWTVGGVKLFVDGTIDGGTAWLEYADTHGQGLEALWRDFGAFRAVVTRLHLAGVNVAVHAIGDRGVREVLELFAELRTEHGPLARHRIEHVETIPEEVVKLFGDGAAAASMQPLQPEQALTARQALEGYTTQVAYAAGREVTRGRIAPGFDADFTVFAADPLELSAAGLGVVPIVATVVAGGVVPQD